jgi:type III pantothenate kinase
MGEALLVDLGNSRIKWGTVSDGVITQRGVHTYDEQVEFDASMDRLAVPDRIVASNVAGEKGEYALASAIARWRIAPSWVSAVHHAFGVTNCYDDPQRLGPDRWAALVAVHAMQPGECLIISLGTAMTLDWLQSDGHFAGGMIIPGTGLMREALAGGTANIQTRPGKRGGFSCNTVDAVESGLACALAGAANRAYRDIQEATGQAPACLMTGGDAKWMEQLLDYPAKLEPDLVLKGLALIAKGNS